MGLRCTWKVCRLCFGKDIFLYDMYVCIIYIYTHVYEEAFSKTQMSIRNTILLLVLIILPKRVLHIYIYIQMHIYINISIYIWSNLGKWLCFAKWDAFIGLCSFNGPEGYKAVFVWWCNYGGRRKAQRVEIDVVLSLYNISQIHNHIAPD